MDVRWKNPWFRQVAPDGRHSVRHGRLPRESVRRGHPRTHNKTTGDGSLPERPNWFVPSLGETWLILPVVICLSQRLSHACFSLGTDAQRTRPLVTAFRDRVRLIKSVVILHGTFPNGSSRRRRVGVKLGTATSYGKVRWGIRISMGILRLIREGTFRPQQRPLTERQRTVSGSLWGRERSS